MMLFLILAPFAVFGALMMLATPAVSLFAACAVALGTIAYDLARGRSVKALAAGAAVLFAAVGTYLVLSGGGMGDHGIRLAIDLGVLAIALGSIALRLPFTLQYAREVVEPEIIAQPAFMTTNYILTWAWVGAFILMLVADILLIYWPSLPVWIGVGVAFAARNCAVYFTNWYSARRRAQFARQAP
jgi:hypothetical protein